MTLLPIKETRVSVNEMFAAGIVDTVDMGEKGLVYFVKIPLLRQEAAMRVYLSMRNLKIRLKSEVEKACHLMN